MLDKNYKSKILVVHGIVANLAELPDLISSDDVEVIDVKGGEQAFEKISMHDFAVAILDTQLPFMSAFALARMIKSAERSRNIPIIFVNTSERCSEEQLDAYSHGAVDYLFGPLVPFVVRAKVRVLVELDQKSKALAAKLAEIERLKLIVESGSNYKNLFLANMSHEIRTPLGSIIGNSDLLALANSNLNEDTKLIISRIQRNSRILQTLIDDILDISKIEAGKIQVDYQSLSMGALIRDIQASHQYNSEEKGLEFTIQPTSYLPSSICTDANLLRQILNNIISNAIKFTQNGSVRVEIYYDPAGWINFKVVDSGSGLSDEGKAILFKARNQGDEKVKLKFGGLGFGLARSKTLAEQIDGDIQLDQSEIGKGSTFVARFKIDPVDSVDLISPLDLIRSTLDTDVSNLKYSKLLSNVRALVVDDIEDNRFFVSRFLENAGAIVTTAESGQVAIDRVNSMYFDVIIMDIQMPVLDGAEATKSIRSLGHTLPIIALSAHVMKEEKDKYLESGFSGFLRKPVSRQELIEKIQDQIIQHKRVIMNIVN